MKINNTISTDFVIVGGGIIGLTLSYNLSELSPSKSITLIEKESDVGLHSSGRNSGVLHAGFYYSSDSLKAKFSKEGNLALKKYCKEKEIPVKECGKVVVAQNEKELERIIKLKQRGDKNKVLTHLIDEKDLIKYEPNAKTYKKALWSPTTATVNPKQVCITLKEDLEKKGVKLLFNTPYKKRISKNTILVGKNTIIEYGKLINCAGLYADKIAKEYNFSQNYVIIPFKGIYLEYTGKDNPIKTNIYPVPHPKNPFLGVHYTLKADGTIKIGPTAIPCFWRENYKGLNNFNIQELFQVLTWETKLFITNKFGFRDLAFEEIKKYSISYLRGLAKKLVKNINIYKFNKWGTPGVRAQLLNIKTYELLDDFVIEGDKESIHVLNAVSPAFTCSFPFTKWIIENYII